MKTIRFFFDYAEDPVWYKDGDDDTESPGLPPICSDNVELKTMMDELVEEYVGLFIANTYEFTFVGFKDEESYQKFVDKVNCFIEKLKKAVEPEYVVNTKGWELDCKMKTLMDGEV